MEITCTQYEKELLICELAGKIACPMNCCRRTLEGCSGCVTEKMNIQWIIKIPIERKD